jgi:hypothetical protein
MNKNSSKQIINKLIATKFTFNDDHGNPIEISKKGNLGLLAIGYKGLIAMRQKRKGLKQISTVKAKPTRLDKK